ncbi:MAG: hypothetical protein WCI36_05225 [bacterium]
MSKYLVEYKIATLLKNAVNKKDIHSGFEFDDILFTHWDFNSCDGWIDNAWLVSGIIEAKDGIDAANNMKNKIQKIISRVSLIGQAYIEHYAQPFLVRSLDNNKSVALFYFTKEVDPVPLMFQNSERKIMEKLVRNQVIPEEFFFYWKDTVNTFGYSSKLLLMFSAIEALAKSLSQKNYTKKHVEIINILGEDLGGEIWKNKTGLRHRLVHGEYLQEKDKRDYIEEIHRKVLNFFNNNILDEEKISLNIVHPQRNLFFGNGLHWFGFIKAIEDENILDLKSVLNDFMENEINCLLKYEILHGEHVTNLKKTF